MDDQLNAELLRGAFVPVDDGLEQALDREHADVECNAAVLVAGEIEQVHHDALEAVRFVSDCLEVQMACRRVELDVWHAQRVDIAANGRERRAELVRDVGQHLAPLTVSSVQRLGAGRELVGHAIERAGNVGDSSRPPSGARTCSSPAPKRMAASSSAWRRRRAGPKMTIVARTVAARRTSVPGKDSSCSAPPNNPGGLGGAYRATDLLVKSLSRREVLGVLGAAAGAAIAAGCGDSPTSPSAVETTTTATTSATAQCAVTPTETTGPFPSRTDLLRSDVREGRAGTPLTLNVKVVNVNSACAAVADAQVEIWHCDEVGNYSQYGTVASQTFYRGIQTTDPNGNVPFVTNYPGW